MRSYNQMIEERNYWNDARTLAAMTTPAYEVVESNDKTCKIRLTDSLLESLIEEEILPEDHDGILEMPTKYEVCGLCNGAGKVVNPSIDASGVCFDTTHPDFDPDFEENYNSGVYDIVCPTCKAKRVVPKIEFTGDLKMAVQHFIEEEAQYARLVASERAMGC